MFFHVPGAHFLWGCVWGRDDARLPFVGRVLWGLGLLECRRKLRAYFRLLSLIQDVMKYVEGLEFLNFDKT